MLNRVHIQILDNPTNWVPGADGFGEQEQNQMIAEELRNDLNYNYPTVTSVEYIDLFNDESESFREIRELLNQGIISAPVVLINGVPKIHGGIPSMLIKTEVEKIISSGPVH
ncbi:MAG: hypothetical protein M0033_07585 [Nitrospiraceae bacterium]|nr:hypothetical protein [Nitrospiraceae bacterium]MDA8326064.1 hypothetical protein [Nitrospiraceae bacterium]